MAVWQPTHPLLNLTLKLGGAHTNQDQLMIAGRLALGQPPHPHAIAPTTLGQRSAGHVAAGLSSCDVVKDLDQGSVGRVAANPSPSQIDTETWRWAHKPRSINDMLQPAHT